MISKDGCYCIFCGRTTSNPEYCDEHSDPIYNKICKQIEFDDGYEND